MSPVPNPGVPADAGKSPVWDGSDYVLADLPWHVQIVPMLGTIPIIGTLSTYAGAFEFGGGAYNNSSAQNDEFGWDLVLAKGTWLFEGMYQKSPNGGIASVKLDGAVIGSVDLYAAATINNFYFQIPNIAVASSGKKRLTFKAASRNAASTGWIMAVQGISLRRTA